MVSSRSDDLVGFVGDSHGSHMDWKNWKMWKSEKPFPVREKSGNFERLEKSGNFTQNTGKVRKF